MKRRPSYIVAAKNEGGFYVVATHRTFRDYTDAENYKLSVAVAREPIVVCINDGT